MANNNLYDPVDLMNNHPAEIKENIDDMLKGYHPDRFEHFVEKLKIFGISLVEPPYFGNEKTLVGNVTHVPDNLGWFNCYEYTMLKVSGVDVRKNKFLEINRLFSEITDFIDWDDISKSNEGDIIIYQNDILLNKHSTSDDMRIYFHSGRHHWGILRKNGLVESKWGISGPVLLHPLHALPSKYDGEVSFYRRKQC